MGWSTIGRKAMGLVTLGGYGKLETAKAAYQAAYEEYELNRRKYVLVENEKQERLNDLIKVIRQSYEALRQSQKILGRAVTYEQPPLLKSAVVHDDVQPLKKKFKSRGGTGLSTGITAAGGVGVGTAAAAGSWAVLGAVGTASTGTAISTLSGAAASNAILAQLGGGALAAGGAGMAGGTLVLGSVVLAPVVAISVWSSHRKANEIDHETDIVQCENRNILKTISDIQCSLSLVKDRIAILQSALAALKQEISRTKSEFYPARAWSLRRWIGQRFGRQDYWQQDGKDLERLKAAVLNFIDGLRLHAEEIDKFIERE